MNAPKQPTEDGFTADERAAMKEHAKELRATRARKAAGAPEDAEADVLAKIAEMTGTDRAIAERLHEIVREHAPGLTARTWYGMPAYAKGGKVLCFLQPAAKFKARYATLGFNDGAALDDGAMWATSFAVTELTPEVERRIAELVTRAAG
jgi:uncharacterized protein YdhG (YjbR/CyaY superfamily)